MTDSTRELASKIASLEAWQRNRAAQLAYSAIEAGAIREFDLDGNQTGQYGRQYDGTSGAAVLVSPAPPVPTNPVVKDGVLGATVKWDGMFVGGLTVVAPMDLKGVEIVAGPVGFDIASTPPFSTITSARGGEIFVPLPVGTFEVVLVARTLAGRASSPSGRVTVQSSPAVTDAELAAIQADVDAVPAQIQTGMDEATNNALAGSLPREPGSVTSTYIAGDAVQASHVSAFAIGTQHLAVGALSNQVPGGVGEFGGMTGSFLDGEPGVTFSTTSPPTGVAGYFTSSGGTAFADGARFWDVEPNSEHLVEVWVKASVANSKIFVELRDQSGAHATSNSAVSDGSLFAGSGVYPVSGYTVPTVWTKVTSVAKTTATATKMRLAAVYFNHTSGTVTNATQSIAIRVRPRAAGRLVVDGSIAANHLGAGSVTAGKVAANAIIAGNVAANAIVADNIAADAITGNAIAAGAIDGMVITGSTLQTAATGGRITARPGAASHGFGQAVVQFYSGVADEDRPGEITAITDNADGTGNASLYLTSPVRATRSGSAIQMFSEDSDSVSAVWVTGQAVQIQGATTFLGNTAGPTGVLAPGRRFATHGAAIRNSGTGWGFIDDANHRPTGFASIEQLSDRVRLHFNTAATKVTAWSIVPDETLAAMGIRCGTSVGLGYVDVLFYSETSDSISDYVYYNGTSWVSFNGVFTGISYSAGLLTLTHENMGTTGQQAVLASPRGTAAALSGGFTATTSQVNFYTGAWGSLVATGAASSTQHKVYVARHGKRAAGSPRANPANIVSASGNFWVTGFNEV